MRAAAAGRGTYRSCTGGGAGSSFQVPACLCGLFVASIWAKHFQTSTHHSQPLLACVKECRGKGPSLATCMLPGTAVAPPLTPLPCLLHPPRAAIGRLCEKCDGKCPICDSYVRPATLVRVCDECNYGSYEGRCVICGGVGVSDAYYCKECTLQEKDVSVGVWARVWGTGRVFGGMRCAPTPATAQHSIDLLTSVLPPCCLRLLPSLPCSGMAAPRSSTWAVQKQISSMNERNMASGSADACTHAPCMGAD